MQKRTARVGQYALRNRGRGEGVAHAGRKANPALCPAQEPLAMQNDGGVCHGHTLPNRT